MKFHFTLFFVSLVLFNSHCSAQKTLNRGNGSEPDSLNIHLAQGVNAHNILRDMYEGLMTLNKHGKPIYGMAKSHAVKGNTWTFTLKKNIYWSNGQPVTAHDFVRSWQYAIDPKTAAPYAFLLENIIHAKKIMRMKMSPENLSVKAIDQHTLRINLWQPDPSFLEKLSLPIFYPMHKNHTKTFGRKKFITNGPYQLTQWKTQEKIILQKNSYYYDVETLFYDQINYWVTDDQSSELKRFRADELDITESIPDNQIKWIKQNLEKELRISPYLGSFFLGLNLKDKYLQNHQLRQALSLAVDRKILTDKVLKTGQKPAHHIIPRALLNSTSFVPQLDSQTQRNKTAQKLLKESGIRKHDLTIEILYNSSQNQRKVAVAVAAMWRQTLGIRSRLINQEWKVFTQSRKSIQRQAFRSGWIADYADPMSFLTLFTQKSDFNFYRYHNENYEKIIDRIAKTTEQDTREQLIEQAENILLHDIPVIPLYYYVSRHLVKSHIKGFENNVSDRHLSKYLYENEEPL